MADDHLWVLDGGYWIGLLWSAYATTKREKYLKWVREWAILLEPGKNYKNPDFRGLRAAGSLNPKFLKCEMSNLYRGKKRGCD